MDSNGKIEIATPRWAVPLLDPCRYKGARGGRSSGKSHYFAEAVVEAHVLDPDFQSVCVREIQRSLKFSAKKLIESKIRDLGVSHLFDVTLSEIRRIDGTGIIIFNGLQDHTADSIKSLEGFDLAWCEEAQSLSARSIELLVPTIRKPGAELWFSWNPELEKNAVEELFRENPDSVLVHVNYTDNPWCPPEMIKLAEWQKKRDYEKYKHIWLGGFNTKSDSLVFAGKYRVEQFDTPDDAVFYFGADWGFSQDPTTLNRMFIDGRTLYIDHEASGVGVEIDDTPALFDTVPRSRKWQIRADSARPETISYMCRQGFKIVPATKGKNSIEDGIEFLRSYDIVVHERCKGTAAEFGSYSYKVDKLTGEVLPVLVDKDNHFVDGIRYALESVRKKSKFMVN